MLVLALTLLLSSGGITLEWDANQESDIAGYNVYRSAEGAPFEKINQGLVEEPTYTDSNFDARITYQYYVTAVNDAGLESDPSNTVEGNYFLLKLVKIREEIAIIQDSTRSMRSDVDDVRQIISDLQDRMDNDPEMITRRFVAGNIVRQYEIILSHLNTLLRLLGEIE